MRSVNADDPPEAVVREILESPYTRMPLWRGSTDNIVGVVHAKDLLRALHEVGNDLARIDIIKVAPKPWFVPDTHHPEGPAQRLPAAQGAFRRSSSTNMARSRAW